MSPASSLATIAEYFKLGLQVGMLQPSQAVTWADAVIASAEIPPEGIIDVAWSNGPASAIDALSAVPGERDKKIAGHWLLGLLRQSLPESEEELQLAAARALQIARQAELGDETYYRFDMIDDELSLARTKVYGTVEQCRADLVALLADYEPIQFEPDA
jgi:hypothetical protein